MRLSADKLRELTGRTQAAAQIRWFKEHLGAVVPRDAAGPIITRAAVERLLQERLGLGVTTTTGEAPRIKPATTRARARP